jgi:hypothetical protein
MKKQRKHRTPGEKVAILRRHLVEGMPISDLCDELGPARRVTLTESALSPFQAEPTHPKPVGKRVTGHKNKATCPRNVLTTHYVPSRW